MKLFDLMPTIILAELSAYFATIGLDCIDSAPAKTVNWILLALFMFLLSGYSTFKVLLQKSASEQTEENTTPTQG